MTHEDKGHFAGKHDPGRNYQPEIAQALFAARQEQGVACAVAHDIADRFGVPPSEVGFTLDTLEIPICKCQLGLFGYLPSKRIVKPADEVAPELEEAIRRNLTEGRIGCKAAWDLAKAFGIPRMAVSSACEALGIKVSKCQLGAF